MFSTVGSFARGAILAVLLVGLAAERLVASEPFRRGDVDESGRVDMPDAIAILLGLFSGEAGGRLRCEAAADADDDDVVSVSDAIFILRALFQGGPWLPTPYDCGHDMTGDRLGCEVYYGCDFRFAGIPYEGDGFYFVVDRSAYMAGSGEVSALRAEMKRSIQDMPEFTETALILFDSGITRFPSGPDPLRVEERSKYFLFEFLDESGPGDASTCPVLAFSSAFDFTARGTARRNVIFFVHATQGTCGPEDEAQYLDETLDAITSMNRGTAQIHTFSIHPIGPARREFLSQLAEANGGVYAALWD